MIRSNVKSGRPLILLFGLIFGSYGERLALGEAPRNLEEIQGRWHSLSFTQNGKAMPNNQSLEIKKDHFILSTKMVIKRRLVLDETQVPAAMDLIEIDNTGREQKTKCVIEVTDSLLVICSALPGSAERPDRLESSLDGKATRREWKRRSGVPAKDSPLSRRLDGAWQYVWPFAVDKSKSSTGATSIWTVKDGSIVDETTLVADSRMTLHEGSSKADLSAFDANDPTVKRTLIDYDARNQILKVCVNPRGPEGYLRDFLSTPENRTSVFIFEKDKPTSP